MSKLVKSKMWAVSFVAHEDVGMALDEAHYFDTKKLAKLFMRLTFEESPSLAKAGMILRKVTVYSPKVKKVKPPKPLDQDVEGLVTTPKLDGAKVKVPKAKKGKKSKSKKAKLAEEVKDAEGLVVTA